MAGGATKWLDDGSAKSMTTEQVLAYWKLGDTRTELLVQGVGSTSCRKWLKEKGQGEHGIQGEMNDVARYLGPHITPKGTADFEIPRRCEAAKTAFYAMGAFGSLSTPWRWKRAVFQGTVMGAILSGMECFKFIGGSTPAS